MAGEETELDEEDADAPVEFSSKNKSNTGDKSHIDMTPMVDVVFQLLTFFLLAVKRDSAEPLDVPITTHSTAVAESQTTFITIKPAPKGSPDPIVIIGENRRGEGDQVTPEKIKEAVEKGVHGGRPNIIVKAERFCKHGDVLKVCRVVAGVEGAVLYVGVQNRE